MKLLILFFCLSSFFSWSFFDEGKPIEGFFSRPVSITHSLVNNCYFVSNTVRTTLQRNNEGFITRIMFDKNGKVETDVIISGGENGVTLHYPRGLFFKNKHLYVVDIDTIRIFTQKGNIWIPVNNIKVAGAILLTEIFILRNNTMFITDSGNDCVYKLLFPYDRSEKLFAGKIKEPTGIWADDKKSQIFVSSIVSGDLVECNYQTNKILKVHRLRAKSIYNICKMNEKFLITDSKAEKVYSFFLNNNQIERETINRESIDNALSVFYDEISDMILVIESGKNRLRIFKNNEE